MPDVTVSYGTPFNFIAFFWYFHTLLLIIHVYIAVFPPNFHLLYIQSILICQNARFDCKLWNALWFYYDFLVNFVNFAQNWQIFMSEVLYFHQTFTNRCIWCEYEPFAIIKCQMWLPVTERSLILWRFLGIFMHNWRSFMSEVLYLRQTFTDYVSNQYPHFDMLTCQI